MSKNYKIAVVGTKMITAGFATLGCEVKNANSALEAKELLFELKKEKQIAGDEESPQKYAIIFVLEDFIKDISVEDYSKISSGALPAIIPIPSHKGSTGFGETKIRRIVEQAVGSDIFG
jgi:V/A-type H+/Na+-transporting ATPase subunit F